MSSKPLINELDIFFYFFPNVLKKKKCQIFKQESGVMHMGVLYFVNTKWTINQVVWSGRVQSINQRSTPWGSRLDTCQT